jgi:NifU-like protein
MSITITEKMSELVKKAMHRGALFQIEAEEKGFAMLEAKVGSLKIYAFVDPDSDTITDIRFFTYGGPAYTALAEALCSSLDKKPVSFIQEVSPESIDPLLHYPQESVVREDGNELWSTVSALTTKLTEQYPEKKNLAMATAVAIKSKTGKTTWEAQNEREEEWLKASIPERLIKLELILNEHIRHGLNMDGGDVEILELSDAHQLKVRYLGACGSCGASTGGTLFYIENKLRE